jgi:hypothetical protein
MRLFFGLSLVAASMVATAVPVWAQKRDNALFDAATSHPLREIPAMRRPLFGA